MVRERPEELQENYTIVLNTLDYNSNDLAFIAEGTVYPTALQGMSSKSSRSYDTARSDSLLATIGIPSTVFI
jgi:hypothetical protein